MRWMADPLRLDHGPGNMVLYINSLTCLQFSPPSLLPNIPILLIFRLVKVLLCYVDTSHNGRRSNCPAASVTGCRLCYCCRGRICDCSYHGVHYKNSQENDWRRQYQIRDVHDCQQKRSDRTHGLRCHIRVAVEYRNAGKRTRWIQFRHCWPILVCGRASIDYPHI